MLFFALAGEEACVQRVSPSRFSLREGNVSFEIRRRGTQRQLIEKSGIRRSGFAASTAIASAAATPRAINDLLPEQTVVRRAISSLKPPKRGLRKAGKGLIEGIIKSLNAVGQIAPVLIDKEGRVVDGQTVVMAAKKMGMTHVNCVCLENLNDEQIAFARIALNKLGEGSSWELEELRPALEELQLVGFDLSGTGFTLAELDIILQPEPHALAEESDELLSPPDLPVSRPGDLWRLGDHVLLCGDALEARSYAMVLGSRLVDAVFTDCPWNIPIAGFVSGLGKTKHKDFKMAAGEMSDDAFQEFVDVFTQHCTDHLEDGGVFFSCIDWRSSHRIHAGAAKAGLTHLNTAVWNKGSGGMGGLYRSAHEFIHVLCKGKSPKTNNILLGTHGRDRTNVWSYPGANRGGSSAGKALKHHPTPKPVDMVEDAILDVTLRGELLLDPFMGSGTTLLAAERSGRLAVGIEIDPAYVDVCIRRWEEMTGKSAANDEGIAFQDMAALRAAGEDLNIGGIDVDDK